MRERLTLMLRSALYAMRADFSSARSSSPWSSAPSARFYPSRKRYIPELDAWIPEVLFPAHQDPQVALSILSGIASSIMTVVSIVFAILLMTLTLASTQFSPRILVSFVRDRATQWTLGIFLGTFSYCMAALPSVRSLPKPYVPVLTVLIAMVLALVCVGWLIFFINHISRSISVNYIVDRIAGEALLVIDELMPRLRGPTRDPSRRRLPIREKSTSSSVAKRDMCALSTWRFWWNAPRHSACRSRSTAGVGRFVPAGAPLASGCRRGRVTSEREASLADRDRHRSDPRPAAGRRIRRHPDRRHRASSDLAGGQRSDHGDQLHRSAEPHHDRLDEPCRAAVPPSTSRPTFCASRCPGSAMKACWTPPSSRSGITRRATSP